MGLSFDLSFRVSLRPERGAGRLSLSEGDIAVSNDWPGRKVQQIKERILARKQADEAEAARVTQIKARALPLSQSLLQDIRASVERFNSYRQHEEFGHAEIPGLTFSWVTADRAVLVEAPDATLLVQYDADGPSVQYSIERKPKTPADRRVQETGTLTFVRDGEHVWLQNGGDKLSAPAAADYLLDKII